MDEAAGRRGHTSGESGLTCPSNFPALPSSQSSQFPSSTLLNPFSPSTQMSVKHFNAFEAAVNNGGSAILHQVRYIRNSVDDAIVTTEHFRENCNAESIFSSPSGGIAQISGSSGESGHRNCGKEDISDLVSTPMDMTQLKV